MGLHIPYTTAKKSAAIFFSIKSPDQMPRSFEKEWMCGILIKICVCLMF